MLGRLDVVKALIASTPGLQRARGPHGISLLEHAQAGGKEAEPVLAFLHSLDGAASAEKPAQPDEAAQARYIATYAYGRNDTEQIEILLDRQGRMTFRRKGGSAVRLFQTGPDEFHPGGASAVRIRFEGNAKPANRITIADGKREWVGTLVK